MDLPKLREQRMPCQRAHVPTFVFPPCTVLAVVAAHGLASPAWVTVGDPGNVALSPDHHSGSFYHVEPRYGWGRGSVDHTYQMMQTPVTVSEWQQFADLIRPVWTPPEGPDSFYGQFFDPDTGNYGPDGTSNNWVATVSIDLMAAYANWLHNGQGDASSIFDGVYDLSTFQYDDRGTLIYANLERPEDARYWIPSIDESIKAAYYDPNRFGDGEGGWWAFPNMSDDLLTPGPPGLGNTADTDEFFLGGDVGLYPDTASAWGVLDVAGPAPTWAATEDEFTANTIDYHVLGHENFFAWSNSYYASTSLDSLSLRSSFGGIRLARAIPSPGAAASLVFAAALACRRASRR